MQQPFTLNIVDACKRVSTYAFIYDTTVIGSNPMTALKRTVIQFLRETKLGSNGTFDIPITYGDLHRLLPQISSELLASHGLARTATLYEKTTDISADSVLLPMIMPATEIAKHIAVFLHDLHDKSQTGYPFQVKYPSDAQITKIANLCASNDDNEIYMACATILS